MAALAAACFLTLAFGVPLAEAAPKGTVGFIGSAGTGAGQFNSPRGVAVKNSTGDLYVVDSANHRVQQFDALGFVRAWGWGVKTGAEAFEVCDAPGPCLSGRSGEKAGQFASPQGIAVDQDTGAVYVTSQNNRRVDKFGIDGNGNFNFLFAFGWGVQTGAAMVEQCMADATGCRAGVIGPTAAQSANAGQFANFFLGQLAVDPRNGDVVVGDPASRRVQKFNSSGQFLFAFGWGVDSDAPALEQCTTASTCQQGRAGSGLGQFATNQPTRIAVDSSGSIYVVEPVGNRRVQKFNAAATSVSLFAPAQTSGTSNNTAPSDIAVDAANDHVLVSKANDSTGTTERRVLEFDIAAGLTDTHAAGAGLPALNGMGVDSSTDRIYLSTSTDQRVFVLGAVTPPTATIAPATDVAAESATLNGTVNPNGGSLSTGYHFEYGTDGVNWTSMPATDVDVGNGTADVPVSQPITGLEPNTTYRVRLVARRPFGGGSATSTEETFTTDPLPPSISGVGAFNVTDTSAVLRGQVDPNHAPTTYRFDYGTDASYGSTTAEGSAGSGPSSVPVSKAIFGLQPNTTYHFRLVAANPAGETEGPDQTFTTDADPPQPSGRAYELVSPPDKGGYEVSNPAFPGDARAQASITGDAVTFASAGVFPGTGAESAASFVTYLARRPASGQGQWRTVAVTAPLPNEDAGGDEEHGTVRDLSDDLSLAVMPLEGVLPGDPPAPPERRPLYLRNNVTGHYELLTPDLAPLPPGEADERDEFQASDDFAHVVWADFSPNMASDPLPRGQRRVYESFVNPQGERRLRLASILPDGTPTFAGLGGPLTGAGGNQGTVSNDGERIFFTAPVDNVDQLFVREHGTTTTLISDTGPFRGATPDGSKVFSSDVSGSFTLRRHDLASTPMVTTPIADGVETPFLGGVLGYSDDGSRLYFAATAQLVPEAPAAGTNLYVWEDGPGGGTITFIARQAGGELDISNWDNKAQHRSSRVTPDGEYLLFLSFERVTAFDNRGTRQLYLYRRGAGVECVSCPGRVPTVNASLAPPSVTFTDEQVQNLTDDGRRVFFQSSEALVPQDGNGRQDVYAYDTETREVELISSGRSTSNSHFADASPEGDDVFFATREPLVGWDQDGLYDLYDARIGGGLPEPPATPAECSGDECQGRTSGPPGLVGPATPLMQGSGDEAPAARPAFSIRRLSQAQRSSFARTGSVTLAVRVNGPGRVSAAARARIGGRSRLVARRAKRASRAGIVKLKLRVSKAAFRQLSGTRRLRVSVSVRFAGVREGERLTLAMRRAPARADRRVK